MADLVEFLRARLNEDRMNVELIPGGGYLPARWVSLRVPDGQWAEIRQYDQVDENDWEEIYTAGLMTWGRNEDEHVARYDPRRILAEIKVKYAVVDAYDLANTREIHADAWLLLRGCAYAMAAIWADHPDFDPSWAVTE